MYGRVHAITEAVLKKKKIFFFSILQSLRPLFEWSFFCCRSLKKKKKKSSQVLIFMSRLMFRHVPIAAKGISPPGTIHVLFCIVLFHTPRLSICIH